MKMNKTINYKIWKQNYKETWEYQEELFKGIVDLKISNRRGACFRDSSIFCSEHPCVYTGESGDLSNFVVEKQLEDKGATFYKINRGGDTYHGPGQIVGYPIIR
jgi:lipoyl(octanoyl) transferase